MINLTIASFFSIIFSASCAVFLFIGIYAFYLDPRSRTNILFFNLTVALGLWVFGFSMAVAAEGLEAALFWRRFAAIGFCTFFVTLLRFSLVFTGHHPAGRKWFAALLYLPAAVVLLGFTYFPSLNPEQYNMVETPLGWVNIAVNNAWDWLYMAYYILYTATALFLFWKWGRRSFNPKEKRRSRLILISFITAMLLGSLTDILGNIVFDTIVPQLAPLFMLFPAFVMYYMIKKHGFLNPRQTDMESILLSDQIRTKMTNYMSNACLVAALLNLIANYFLTENADLFSVLSFSIVLIGIGVVLQAIQRSVKNKNLKDILNSAVFALMVPLLTFQYIGTAGTTLWAFPMFLLVVTLIYGKGFLQIILFTSILLTQIVVWLMKPEVTITIDSADHVVRLGIFLITIFFALFAKRIFQSKLQENADQINSQNIITQISTELISVNAQNLDDKINAALFKLGTFMLPDRIYICLFDEKTDELVCRNTWSNPEKATSMAIGTVFRADSFPLFTTSIRTGKPIVLSDVADDAYGTGAELPQLLGSFKKSFAAMPVIVKEEIIGFLGMEADRKTKNWPETQLSLLQIISNILADTYERIQQDKVIADMAFYDYLTRLPNRILFKDRVAQAINLTERTGKTLAVVFLDLDAFKAVNDTLGHDGGDALIIQTAELLKNNLRKSDAVARFGGDEFLILLNNLNSTNDVQNIIEKIFTAFDQALIVDEQEFFVTASAGIAVYPRDGTDPETLIKNADIAMYRSKESGKNRYMFCTEDMKEEILQKARLTGSLFHALERHELQLYYQPQICTRTQQIIGAEALLRWFHPEFGMIAPGLFIPLAEQTGLIGPIGDWVLMTACLQCKTWHLKGLQDIRIAVNVSVLQLRNPGFVYRVRQILDETQLEPKYLELEVTESAMVSESDYINEVLEQLTRLGISISIDDFGTEYSSLSRLTAMPINRIKLDMQFVHNIGRSEKEDSIIKGIIGLAHTLGLRVTAEGVETKAQLDFLTERKSDEIQGFYFYRPVPPAELETMLKQELVYPGETQLM